MMRPKLEWSRENLERIATAPAIILSPKDLCSRLFPGVECAQFVDNFRDRWDKYDAITPREVATRILAEEF